MLTSSTFDIIKGTKFTHASNNDKHLLPSINPKSKKGGRGKDKN